MTNKVFGWLEMQVGYVIELTRAYPLRIFLVIDIGQGFRKPLALLVLARPRYGEAI